MGKKNRLSRDQRRKGKLKKRQSRELSLNSLAYFGRKYQRDDLVRFYFAMECGIHSADLLTRRRMMDVDVRSSLESLVALIRSDGLPEDVDAVDDLPGTVQSLIIANVLQEWHDAFEKYERPSNSLLIGILRTTLGSIATRGEMRVGGRGYLVFLEHFLKGKVLN